MTSCLVHRLWVVPFISVITTEVPEHKSGFDRGSISSPVARSGETKRRIWCLLSRHGHELICRMGASAWFSVVPGEGEESGVETCRLISYFLDLASGTHPLILRCAGWVKRMLDAEAGLGYR